jgi:hypothetical protein
MPTKKFLLTWSAPVAGGTVSGYRAEYSLAGQNSWILYNDIFNTTSGFVTGLSDCTFYDFRVSAFNGLGTGNSSNTGTNIQGNLPFAPTNLSGNPTDTTIALSWTMQNNGGCPISGSFIEYKTTGNAEYTVSTLSSTGTSYTITGLVQNTGYNIRVRSASVVGTGLYSSGIILNTQITESVPGEVGSLQVQYVEMLDAPTGLSISVNSTTGNLTWIALDTTNQIPLSGYYVRYKNISGTNWTTSSLFTTNSGTIGSLTGTDCYSYEFGIASLNISGTVGSYGNSITGNFGTPGSPTNFGVNPAMPGTYQLAWTDPSPSPTGYNIYMTGIKINDTPLNPNSGSFNYNGYVSYDESMQFWTFHTPVESGTMTLSAVNACGEGSQSNGVIVPASPY